MFWPSTYPASRRPWLNASMFSFGKVWMLPTLGSFFLLRARLGHAAAVPPSSASTSARFNESQSMRYPASQGRLAGYRIGEEQSAIAAGGLASYRLYQCETSLEMRRVVMAGDSRASSCSSQGLPVSDVAGRG